MRRNAPGRRERLAARARAARRRGGARRRDPHPLMSLAFLVDRFDELPATRALAAELPARGSRRAVAGLPGSSPAVLIAAVARRLPQRLFVVVAPTPTDAERWLADARALAGDAAVLYPQREALGAEEPHVEIAGERVETLAALLSGSVRILITTARASAERTGVPEGLRAMGLLLETGTGKGEEGGGSLSSVVGRLEAMGYARVPTVTEVAQFSVRGGILDVYGFGMAAPARVEWWGDEILSLRTFDLDTQRSGEPVERVTVLPVRSEGVGAGSVGAQHAAPLPRTGQRQSLLELLPSDAVVVLDQESALGQEVERTWADAAHHLEVARRLGEEPLPREELFLEPADWRARLGGFARVAINAGDAAVRFSLAPPEAVDRDMRRLRQVVAGAPPPRGPCGNEGQLERPAEPLCRDPAAPPSRALERGFILPGLRILTDHEIFRRA